MVLCNGAQENGILSTLLSVENFKTGEIWDNEPMKAIKKNMGTNLHIKTKDALQEVLEKKKKQV
jgi:hypothetical protein